MMRMFGCSAPYVKTAAASTTNPNAAARANDDNAKLMQQTDATPAAHSSQQIRARLVPTCRAGHFLPKPVRQKPLSPNDAVENRFAQSGNTARWNALSPTRCSAFTLALAAWRQAAPPSTATFPA